MLIQFPPEVLSSIFAYSGHVFHLWMCGDRALHVKLSMSVASLSLVHIPPGGFVPPEWLLQFHKLKTLSISSASKLVELVSDSAKVLCKLPRTLESLEIDSKDSDLIFLDPARPVATSFGAGLKAPQYLPVATMFPHLKSLTLKGATNPVRDNFLSVIPSTLTSLSIGDGRFHLPFPAALTSSLQYLDAEVYLGYQRGGSELLQKEFDDLPPGLLISKMNVNTLALPDVQMLAQLPSSLHLLCVSLISPAIVSLLPRSIVKLVLGKVKPYIWAPFVELAAKSAREGHKKDVSSLSVAWPPGLDELSILLQMSDSGVLIALPRHIQRLTLHFDERNQLTTIYADELPRRLKKLELYVPEANTVQIEGKFPPTLQTLRAQDAILPAGLCAALPPSLEELDIGVTDSTPSNVVKSDFTFPPHLKALRLSHWRTNWFGELPSTVTSFYVNRLLPSHTEPFDFFSSLPSGLTSLKVHTLKVKIPMAVPFNAGQLPALSRLWLPQRMVLQFSDIKHLPRSMRALTLYGATLTESARVLADLPPFLEECSISIAAPLTSEMGLYWPPTAWRCLLPHADWRSHITQLRHRLCDQQGSRPTSTPSSS